MSAGIPVHIRNLVHFLLGSLDPKHLSLEADRIQKTVYDHLRTLDDNFLRSEEFISSDDAKDPDMRERLFHSLAAQTSGSFVVLGACLATLVRLTHAYGMGTWADICIPDNPKCGKIRLAFSVVESKIKNEQPKTEGKSDTTRIAEGTRVKEMFLSVLSQPVSDGDEYDESEFDLTEEEFRYASGRRGFDSVAESVRSKNGRDFRTNTPSARRLSPVRKGIRKAKPEERARRNRMDIRRRVRNRILDRGGRSQAVARHCRTGFRWRKQPVEDICIPGDTDGYAIEYTKVRLVWEDEIHEGNVTVRRRLSGTD